MKTMSIQDAQQHLATLIQEVERGEEIVISSDGRPVARLVAHRPVPSGTRHRDAVFGSGRSEFVVPDSFFDPLPEEELRLWEEGYPGDPLNQLGPRP